MQKELRFLTLYMLKVNHFLIGLVRTGLDRLSRARAEVSQVLSIPTHAHTPYRAVLVAERVGVLLDEDLEDDR